MKELFCDIEGCKFIADDLLIWERNEKEHDHRLKKVLDQAQKV